VPGPDSPDGLDEQELLGLRDLAVAVASEAGILVLAGLCPPGSTDRWSERPEAKSSPTDFVGSVDRASEKLVVERILQARPNDGILAEEGGRFVGTSGVTWVIDPLDGTTNFLHGISCFSVSIAAVTGEDPAASPSIGNVVAGAVHDPVHGETFAAALGCGATLNGRTLKVVDPLGGLPGALVGTGFSYASGRRADQARLLPHVLPAVADIRRAGSAALDLCSVACGRLDAYYEAGLSPWDLAAGRLVVTESGAKIELLDGIVPGIPTVVAGAPALHEALVALLRAAARSSAQLGG